MTYNKILSDYTDFALQQIMGQTMPSESSLWLFDHLASRIEKAHEGQSFLCHAKGMLEQYQIQDVLSAIREKAIIAPEKNEMLLAYLEKTITSSDPDQSEQAKAAIQTAKKALGKDSPTTAWLDSIRSSNLQAEWAIRKHLIEQKKERSDYDYSHVGYQSRNSEKDQCRRDLEALDKIKPFIASIGFEYTLTEQNATHSLALKKTAERFRTYGVVFQREHHDFLTQGMKNAGRRSHLNSGLEGSVFFVEMKKIFMNLHKHDVVSMKISMDKSLSGALAQVQKAQGTSPESKAFQASYLKKSFDRLVPMMRMSFGSGFSRDLSLSPNTISPSL
ncbi:hypothetical protein ACI2KR_27460 [Pseudomonas luteola]